ncbi:MAG TPA: hypothetical protein VK557_14865 [Pyrinomonadaceae bacterium]|nr:hypothetical protein [Pyrinomonadaceae bacterium]
MTADSKFKSEDFRTRHEDDPNDPERTILRVEYAFALEFFLQANIKNGSYSVEFCPGVVNLREDVFFDTQQKFFTGVRQWAVRVREELMSGPIQREVAEQRALLEEIQQQVSSFPDEYLTQEEAVQLRERLTALEEKLKEGIENSTKDQAEAKTRISALEADFAHLRETVQGLSKRNWAGALMIRASTWMKDPFNRQLLKSGAEIATHLLTDGKEPPRF